MSGAEQTFDIVGGLAYSNGTRALGSASTADLKDAYGSPALANIYGSTKSDQYGWFEKNVLKANLDSNSETVGEGFNEQMGNADLTFGLKTSDAANQPPLIDATSIDGTATTGERGTPGSGFGPNPASPNGSTSPYDIPPITYGKPPMGPEQHGTNGSQVSPGHIKIGEAADLIHGIPGFRPGRATADSANGAS